MTATRGTAQRGENIVKTPDGRYLVVRGRLWRATDPRLTAERRSELVEQLMDARRSLRRRADTTGRAQARSQVDAAKRGLGERGPVWWTDGAPNYNRKLVKNTPYAQWHAALFDQHAADDA
ncbi:hypothetical protein GCM10007320_65230 [Pseudorhodoferax aquiterrae]|uniref:Uncharacterized protein n=1 Tax=Pseudorhodoferax aquiterrae TaxID=747304 RepID=A0ABQ3GGZ7_9BURK|nr:hypothetical protein [Pseudorhodoferax aquiterrae]GHD04393.1 hypothetical protein GCM10007320_65230 [Pseudorhodoferax aquiterrae]